VVDTEVLFGLNPKDRKHDHAIDRLSELRRGRKKIFVPDTALLEFHVVLRSYRYSPKVIRTIILGLRSVMEINGVEEAKTINSSLLSRQCEIEERYGLTYFDSLIAASTLELDGEIISDDSAFDKVLSISRTPLT
jgi:predicted nucleic acid-binding protein